MKNLLQVDMFWLSLNQSPAYRSDVLRLSFEETKVLIILASVFLKLSVFPNIQGVFGK
jgi:hypothetical protein